LIPEWDLSVVARCKCNYDTWLTPLIQKVEEITELKYTSNEVKTYEEQTKQTLQL
jgi:hypothetical protein